MDTEEVLLESLDLFTKEPALLQVKKSFYEKIPSKSQLSDAALTQLEFSIPSSLEFYTDLTDTFLYLRVKLPKSGANVAAAPLCGTVNFPFASIFRSVEISLKYGNFVFCFEKLRTTANVF